MKQVCLYCNRIAEDENMWCQEVNCPAERSPDLLAYGEEIGDIEIVKLMTVLPTSALYEARRKNAKGKTEKILLKVAHEGYHQRLEREAEILMRFASVKTRTPPMVPVLLPAHPQEKVQEYPYGKTVFRGKTRYYCVYQFGAGDILRNILLKNPQLWYQHVGWSVIGLAEIVAVLHANDIYHFCLSPEVVLVRIDRHNVPRISLIDLGIVSDEQSTHTHWNNRYASPVYTPPELVSPGPRIPVAAVDVYGLGMILYEMLAGHRAYEHRFRTEADIYSAIVDKNSPPLPINRPDLEGLPEIALQAISKDYRQRHESVRDFGGELYAHFPPIPVEKKERKVNWLTVTIIIGVLLAITLLIMLAVSLTRAV